MGNRSVVEKRVSKETNIVVEINLDEKNKKSSVQIKDIPFMEHMLDLFSLNAGFYIRIEAQGDIDIDYHHTVEDLGIVLGKAFNKALGSKKGIKRYSSILLPMDDVLVSAAIDISGRPYLDYNLKYVGLNGLPVTIKGMVGNFDIFLIEHFFTSFVNHSFITLHIDLIKKGSGDKHHIIEAVFKAFGRVLGDATKIEGKNIPSTKGVVE